MLSVLIFKKVIVISVVVFIFSLMQMDTFAGPDWELITQLHTERTGFTTAVVDDEIYLIGGTLAENVKPGKRDRGPFGLSTVEVYNTQKNTWRQRADMLTPRESAQAAVVDGIIYVFGGYSAKDDKIASMKLTVHADAYDPENGTWIRKQDMPISRLYFGLSVVGGKVYLIGGSEGIGEGHERRMDRTSTILLPIRGWRVPKCRRGAFLAVSGLSMTVFMPSADMDGHLTRQEVPILRSLRNMTRSPVNGGGRMIC